MHVVISRLILSSTFALLACESPRPSASSDHEKEAITESSFGGASHIGSGGESPSSGGTAAEMKDLCDEQALEDDLVIQPEPYALPSEAMANDLVPRGSVTALLNYESALYQDVFPYRIYVSHSYDESAPAALLVFQDGSLYVDLFHAPTVLDQLTHAGQIPPVVALFIDTPPGGEARRVEIYDNPSDTYARFVVDEIVPDVIENAFHVTPEPTGRATVGFSAGGTQAMAVLLYRSDSFRKSLGHNSSFLAAKNNGVDMTQLVAALPDQVELKVSLLSSQNDLSDYRGHWLEGNRTMANALRLGLHDVRLVEGTGVHYPPDQAIADFPDGLRWLLANCLGD